MESYQAGLSWEIVLNKREAFREAFFAYDPNRVVEMSNQELGQLLEHPGLIRHAAKLYATRSNAQAFLAVVEEFGSFSQYIWSWVADCPLDHPVQSFRNLPIKTPLSEKLAKDLKKRGFKFLGPVTTYSYLQAAGLLQEHEATCFIGQEIREDSLKGETSLPIANR